MRFRATLLLSGKTATGIEVPPEVVDALGAGKRPAVLVTIGGHTYRSTVATMGGKFMLPVSGENREKAGVQAGDRIEVELQLDTAPREVTVPEDLARALQPEPDARQFFESLSYSQKLWYVTRIDGVKKAETRQRRIEETISMLREGRRP